MERHCVSTQTANTPRKARKFAVAGALALCAPMLLSAQGLHNNFDDRLLASHNRERASVGLTPMDWNPKLADAAREWSDHLAQTGKFEHSPDEAGQPRHGENLWAGTAGYYQAEAMVGLWLDEKQHFVPGTFPHSSTTGSVSDVSHYTQIIWEDTLEVGCAISHGEVEDVLVCRYARPGNIYGEEIAVEAGEVEPDPVEVKAEPFRALFAWLGLS